MKSLSLTLLAGVMALTSFQAMGDSLLDDMNSLGGNKKLVRRAKAIDPKNRLRIVQNRLVDRNWRLELGVNYGAFAGGDPYVNTDQLGGSIDLHVNPIFSFGFRYHQHSNSLSAEGERRAQAVQASRDGGFDPGAAKTDYPLESYLGVINIYPTYGKLNLFNISVVQFDMYLLGGAGQVVLDSGSTETWTAGAGVGVWWSQHITSRFEARYQTYQDQVLGEARDLDLAVFSASFGVML